MATVAIQLTEIVRHLVSSYATKGTSPLRNVQVYYVENLQEQVFSVVAPYNPKHNRPDLVLMARIVNDQVIIDIDKTTVPLFNELKRAGVPESQIVFAWQKNSE